MTENTALIQDDLQDQAVELACNTKHPIVSVTGQAGTGKTTVELRIHQHFTDAGYSIAVAAPTGKAAKRITEVTGLPAMTIHRLLEYTHPGDPDPKTGKPVGVSYPRRTPDNPLPYDVVFVDEYSMVHRELNRNLLDALKPGSVIRMFGDVNQLPPIEESDRSRKWGQKPDPSAFMDFLQKFPSVTLKNIYRQGEGSDIVKNAHRILQGFCPAHSEDFRLNIGFNQSVKIIDLAMTGDVDFATLNNQIITPTHKGSIGTIALNKKLQELLQNGKMAEAHVMPRTKWDKTDLMLTVGDKVLWTKNDYQLEIFNGETGIVESMDHDMVTIDFGDRVVAVPPWIEYMVADGQTKGYDPRTALKLAYVITTHASQGSEYENVVYMMDQSASILQNRPNFYTAVTRARKRTTVISDQRSFQQAVTQAFARI